VQTPIPLQLAGVYSSRLKFASLLVTAISAIALSCVAIPDHASAKGKGHSSGTGAGHSNARHSPRSSTPSSTRSTTSRALGGNHSPRPGSKAAPGIKRDSHGRIKRSASAKSDFKKQHPCPATGKAAGSCPGYVVDHIKPLKRGGADRPSNMQWQTKEAARQKDKTE
jgi:hypothetical protein